MCIHTTSCWIAIMWHMHCSIISLDLQNGMWQWCRECNPCMIADWGTQSGAVCTGTEGCEACPRGACALDPDSSGVPAPPQRSCCPASCLVPHLLCASSWHYRYRRASLFLLVHPSNTLTPLRSCDFCSLLYCRDWHAGASCNVA